jgi:hypothetical protein
MLGEWRKLHNEEFHNLYSSINIIRTIESRKIETSKTRHAAQQTTGENTTHQLKHACASRGTKQKTAASSPNNFNT